jgi:hypothetical protein
VAVVEAVAVEVEEPPAAQGGSEEPRPFFRVKRGSMRDFRRILGHLAMHCAVAAGPQESALCSSDPTWGTGMAPCLRVERRPSGPVRAVTMWR